MNRRKRIYLGSLALSLAALTIAGLSGSLPALRKPSANDRDSGSQNSGRETGKSTDRHAETKLDRKAIDEAAERWYQELLAKHPEFRIEYRTVPDEQNGYLQWIGFLQKLGTKGELPDFQEIREALGPSDKIDIALIEKWIAAHPDLLVEVLRIAELPDRSTKGIAPGQLFKFYSGDFQLLLAAHARLAAAQGDPAAALRSHAAAFNLAGHVDGVEGADMLHSVTAASIRGRVVAELYEYLLPKISADPALLAEARNLLAGAGLGASASQIAIGEWNSATRNFLIPALLGDTEAKLQVIPVTNMQAFLDAYTAGMKEMAAYFNTPAFHGNAAIPQAAALDLLSGQDHNALQTILDFYTGPIEAVRLQQADFVRHQAAMAILGGEEPPLELLTGEPFVWDPVTRQLSFPADMKGTNPTLNPITLP
ncbi:hypothetical protein [Haloferula sp. BvORR071]|uniref:hypothetical protein n=1 Tax=Haloferula sp. BvORR071 TaxID=1396141 RepID=UPI0005588E21|nr:hypothetical protein [Haloferula sp. BvORR071]